MIQSKNGTHYITINTNSFIAFKNISALPIYGIQQDDTALYTTRTVLLLITSKEGDTILAECPYLENIESILI